MTKKRKVYRAVVEGQQEELYLKHLASLLSDFPNKVVSFNTSIGVPKDLKRDYYDYDAVCIFDFDNDTTKFEDNINTCQKLFKQSGKKSTRSIDIAYSNICFDLWLLLHKQDYAAHVSNNNDYIEHIRKAYGLPKNADIKEERYMNMILQKIDLDDVKMAVERAKQIRERNEKEGIAHKVNNLIYYDNPDLNIQSFIDYLIEIMEK